MSYQPFIAKCASHSGPFYFLKKEIFSLCYLLFFLILLFFAAVSFGVYDVFFIILISAIFSYSLYGFLPAYKRSRYIRDVGFYKIEDGIVYFFDSDSNVVDKIMLFESTVSLSERGECQDIILGGGVRDVVASFGDRRKVQFELCKLKNGKETYNYLQGINKMFGS